MAHIGKPSTHPHVEQLAPPPRTVVPSGRMPLRQAHQSSGREHIELVPTSSIDGLAGVRHNVQQGTTSLRHLADLARRLTNPRQSPARGSARRSDGAQTERKELSEEEAAFGTAVQAVLKKLNQDGGRQHRDQVEAYLERHPEPIHRLKILVEAMQQLDSMDDLPQRQKKATKRALDGMITALMKKHAYEIRQVLQVSEDAGVKIDPMADELESSVRLRLLIGAKNAGRFDTPLSPLTVLKALIKNFGSDCLLAMCTLRSRMMSGF